MFGNHDVWKPYFVLDDFDVILFNTLFLSWSGTITLSPHSYNPIFYGQFFLLIMIWFYTIPNFIWPFTIWRCDKILTNVLSFTVAVHILVEDTPKVTIWRLYVPNSQSCSQQSIHFSIMLVISTIYLHCDVLLLV